MNWKRSLTAAVMVLPVLGLFWFGLRNDPRTIDSPLPGLPAPEFTLALMDPPVMDANVPRTSYASGDSGDSGGAGGAGGAGAANAQGGSAAKAASTGATEVSLASHRGEVVVLNFWASWCLACRDEHAPLSRVATQYRDRGVVFYGVLYNDKPEPARRWIKEMGGQSYATLLDPGSRTAIDYGLYGVPETFFIDREGRVAYKHIGPVTESLLIRKLDEILAQQPEQES